MVLFLNTSFLAPHAVLLVKPSWIWHSKATRYCLLPTHLCLSPLLTIISSLHLPPTLLSPSNVLLQHTLNTDEMYGKSEAEVKLQLNEALARKLFDLGELENIIDMAKLQKASIPPYLPLPPRVSAPPSSTPPRLALPYTTSSSSTSYPGSHVPPPSSYPSTSSSKTMIPSYTSKPDTYNSLLTPAPSRRLPPTPDQLERVDRHLKAKDKTAVSCLFEWCQYTKY